MGWGIILIARQYTMVAMVTTWTKTMVYLEHRDGFNNKGGLWPGILEL
jgi:hypothetical protein